MALYTVRYTKASSFIKDAKGLSVNRYDSNGNLLAENDYKMNFLPKVGRNYKVKTSNGKKLVNLSQPDLNKLVEKIGFYDDEGNKITEAPLRNTTAKFWKHPKLKIWLEAAGTNIDDEDPLGLFWLKAFEADYEFRNSLDLVNPAMAGKQKYLVTRIGDDVSEKAKKIDEVLIATEMLSVMDLPKQITVLRAMGVDIRKPDETATKRALMTKITDQKDMLSVTGERYIEQFIRLASEDPKVLNLDAHINQARSMRIISKNSKGYTYGEIPLGRVLEDVKNFLEDSDNNDILNNIIKDIEDKE